MFGGGRRSAGYRGGKGNSRGAVIPCGYFLRLIPTNILCAVVPGRVLVHIGRLPPQTCGGFHAGQARQLAPIPTPLRLSVATPRSGRRCRSVISNNPAFRSEVCAVGFVSYLAADNYFVVGVGRYPTSAVCRVVKADYLSCVCGGLRRVYLYHVAVIHAIFGVGGFSKHPLGYAVKPLPNLFFFSCV